MGFPGPYGNLQALDLKLSQALPLVAGAGEDNCPSPDGLCEHPR